MPQTKEISLDDHVIDIRQDVSDVASLILEIAGYAGVKDLVCRDILRRDWAKIAPELNKSITQGIHNKGNKASHVLKGCLADLEEAGVTQRFGEGRDGYVAILDRPALQRIADLW